MREQRVNMPNGNIVNLYNNNNMFVNLELQIATTTKTVPHPSLFKNWVSVILADRLDTDVELTIRIVDEQEMIQLNHKYRNKNKVTNVLSFPAELDDFEDFPTEADYLEYNVLGDIVICAQVIEKEAKQQEKDLLAHWAHMVVHGVLHLLGFDHQNVVEAEEMEYIETKLMQQLGFSSPY